MELAFDHVQYQSLVCLGSHRAIQTLRTAKRELCQRLACQTACRNQKN